MTYTITIENKTGDVNNAFRYIAFGFPIPTTATRGNPGLPVVFYQSRLLNDDMPVTFTVSQEDYGFLGNSSQTNTALTAGGNVSLIKPIPVTLGVDTDNGTVLEAKPNAARTSVEFKAALARSEEGTFSIKTSNALKEGNKYVVGLAKKVDNIHKPIAVFGLHPGQVFQLTPVDSIYIARDNNTARDTVVNPDSFTVKQQVDLLPDQPNITVTNVANGFQLTYH
jgi:hypothetical protein